MYAEYFGLNDTPFSIAPDPRFLYMSKRHREALAHLIYGVKNDGGFVLLTGEVGTGKTTVCRCFLRQVPQNTHIAFVLNPKLSSNELLATICDEFSIPYTPDEHSNKFFIDKITHFLLQQHARGHNTVLIIDEAQNLSIDVLEQIRLLTNLETDHKKLLQVVMMGQPELKELLMRNELRQLSQRITARYHLEALSSDDVGSYIAHRLQVVGCQRPIFTLKAVRRVYRLSKGIPRIINLLCDRALLGAYVKNQSRVTPEMVSIGAKEVLGQEHFRSRIPWKMILSYSAFAVSVIGVVWLTLDLAGYKPVGKLPVDFASEESEVSGETPASIVANKGALPSIPIPEETSSSLDSIPEKGLIVSRALAFQELYQQWQSQFDGATSLNYCDFAETLSMRCMQGKGTWDKLLDVNRPAVVKLRHASGKFMYGMAYNFSDQKVSLRINEEVIRVDLQTFTQSWTGDYHLFWRLPSGYSGPLKVGQSGPAVEWVANKLGIDPSLLESSSEYSDWEVITPKNQKTVLELPDELTGGKKKVFSQQMAETVKSFQGKNGLTPDGVIGPMTIIRINTAYGGSSIPLLMQSSSAAEV